MSGEIEKDEFVRLEDLIARAKEGKEVELSVALSKQVITKRSHPAETDERKGEIDMYLLIGDYSINVGGVVNKVSKIYVSGIIGEPMNATRQNIEIANSRIKMDYMRLREVNIIFEEVFF
jgi:hypothetical protein